MPNMSRKPVSKVANENLDNRFACLRELLAFIRDPDEVAARIDAALRG